MNKAMENGADRFVDKIIKLALPTAILTGSVILGGFFYASQVNK